MEPFELLLLTYVGAPVLGFMTGAFLLSRIASCLLAIESARKPPRSRGTMAAAALLSSAPWLLAAAAYWAYHVLSQPHAPGWDWFFAAMATAIPALTAMGIYRHRRGRSA